MQGCEVLIGFGSGRRRRRQRYKIVAPVGWISQRKAGFWSFKYRKLLAYRPVNMVPRSKNITQGPRSKGFLGRFMVSSGKKQQQVLVPKSGELLPVHEEEEDYWVPYSGPLNLHSDFKNRQEQFIPHSGQLFPRSSAKTWQATTPSSSKNFPPYRTQGRSASKVTTGNISRTHSRTKKNKQPWNPLIENWDEVVSTVLSKDLDNLVDLEEFFGYYFLLTSPTYREMVEQVFKEFCSDFSVPVASLMVPRICGRRRSVDSSERELECLPPSPCSKQTLSWFTEQVSSV